ncbi:hypothetical protein CYMTET_10889 [Cymbomonas tetramitiformis]|uniref:Uncharacterized protein n=1 Tax=Cymbomonas tetramitiformis TaxID=36881 RepID=A0AAE0GNV4_9CHLO|nr:hypothetical protein CYMTET_10889 [Cymbomonas tetramitiformis]
MGLDGAGLAAELATRLFNATAAARKEHQEKGRRGQRSNAGSARPVSDDNGGEGRGKGRGGRTTGPDGQAAVAEAVKQQLLKQVQGKVVAKDVGGDQLSPTVKLQLGEESPEKSESDSYDDMPLLQRAARPVTAPAVSVKSDSSDEDDMPLAQRAVARFLPADYTFEMITAVPKTFAVTAAGENNPADECWFTVPLARGKVSLPMHYVEVLDLDLEKRLVHWQFWIPRAANLTPASKRKLRTFKNTDLLFIADAFRRGGVRHRAWHPFNPAEMLTCWDERICPPEGGMPSGPEKEELLKTIADNLFSE